MTDEVQRRRGDLTTIPEMIHKIELDRAVERAMKKFETDFLQKFVTNVDRQALANAIAEAKVAVGEARTVANASRRRFMFALACIASLAISAVAMWIYGTTNRELIRDLSSYGHINRARIEFLEQQTMGAR